MASGLPPHPSTYPLRPRRNKIVLIAIANLIALFGLLLVAESGARIWVWYWKVPTQFEPRPFHGFGQTDPLLWWRLQPGLDREAQGVRVRTNSLGFRDRRESFPPETILGFCLGDSTTYGWKIESDQMYTAVAERLLNERTGRPMAVVSAGVPGYSSYQCLQQFRADVLPHHPRWVSILASNNECRARTMGDRERGRKLARIAALNAWLGWSRVWTLLSRAPNAVRRSFEENPSPGRVANRPDEYEQNLREFIRLARAANCKVVVLGVPLRLRYQPFWKRYDRPTPDVAALLSRAQAAENAGEPLGRCAQLWEEALKLQPDQFLAHWRLGLVEDQRGERDLALREFALARDNDLHPEAAKPSYNLILQRLCAAEGVDYIDLDRVFRESGKDPEALFSDHCHLTALGHKLVGEALARHVQTYFVQN